MSRERQETWSQTVTCLGGAYRALRSIAQDDAGVTAIEYGLLAALIVLVALGSIALLGGGVAGMWTLVSTALVAAL